ncbi:MAG: AI-2E family transporter [Hornefia sp.]|nr:AI-2E family transporter [Hornefia sp.]
MLEKIGKRYFKLGVSLVFAGVFVILFFFFMKNLSGIEREISIIIGIIMPFIYGFVMAYLLSPLFNLVTRKTYHYLSKRIPAKKAFSIAKIVASVVSVIVVFSIIAAVAILLVPKLATSIFSLINVMPGRIEYFNRWLTDLIGHTADPKLLEFIQNSVSNVTDYAIKFMKDYLTRGMGNYFQIISTGVMATLRTFLDFLIGIVAALYFLNSKERFKAQLTKLIYAVFSRNRAEAIFNFGYFTNRTFGGFINGKIIDSIIIGFICYVAMMIFNMPYASLCSVIVGVTNVIPFFGPFIGAVPSVIIIAVSDPIKAAEFLVWIFVLQQFDGSVLGPKILGETTGLSSFWVMFAIILGGGLFGFLGMLLGVPVFALIYYYFKKTIEKKLVYKDMSPDTDEYIEFNNYDINRKDVL